MVQIGSHVDQEDPVAGALARGADLAQFFLGDPQGWKTPKVAYPGGAEALAAAAREAGVDLYVHAAYVINVASPNNRIRIPSRKLLQQTLTEAARIGAKGVIVHGGHVTKDDDPEAGYANWRKAAEQLDLACPMLIENTAGGNHAMARRLTAIARLWDALDGAAERPERLGFCLDTCHAFAGGAELGDVVERVIAITGRIDLVHANDSKGGFDSGQDRHENFGQGKIAPDDLVAVVAAAGAPVVCETPGGEVGQGQDIAWLRERLPAAVR